MNDIILQTENLTKNFGQVKAVQAVELTIHRGEVFGFLGPNGSGKTTTIGMILGLIWPSRGRVTLFSQPVSPVQTRPLRQVGSLVGAPALLPYLSGRENLRLVARLHSNVDNARVEEVLTLVNMRDAAGRKFKSYSTGMKQRLGLAAALLHQPALIILDEPTNGLDPAGMREMRDLIRRLADEGITIFLSSHLLHEVEQVCDRIAMLRQGQIVRQGAVRDLLEQGQQVVRLRVPIPAAAREVLATLPGAASIETNGRYLQITGVAGETAVAHLAQYGIIPSEITTRQTDLETLFLELTK